MKFIDKVTILNKEISLYESNGEKYFSASEVGEILEYSKANISKMVKNVDEDEKKQFCVHTNSTSTKARNQNQWFLTKDGLYELLFQSRKDVAKEFKKQVKAILKNIETNGFYIATNKDDSWRGVRQENKSNRKAFTDEVQEFVHYATQKGSSKPTMYYKHFTLLVNKKLNIPSDLERDDLNQTTLMEISALERIITMKLPKLVNKDTPYKEVYKIIKKMIDEI